MPFNPVSGWRVWQRLLDRLFPGPQRQRGETRPVVNSRPQLETLEDRLAPAGLAGHVAVLPPVTSISLSVSIVSQSVPVTAGKAAAPTQVVGAVAGSTAGQPSAVHSLPAIRSTTGVLAAPPIASTGGSGSTGASGSGSASSSSGSASGSSSSGFTSGAGSTASGGASVPVGGTTSTGGGIYVPSGQVTLPGLPVTGGGGSTSGLPTAGSSGNAGAASSSALSGSVGVSISIGSAGTTGAGSAAISQSTGGTTGGSGPIFLPQGQLTLGLASLADTVSIDSAVNQVAGVTVPAGAVVPTIPLPSITSITLSSDVSASGPTASGPTVAGDAVVSPDAATVAANLDQAPATAPSPTVLTGAPTAYSGANYMLIVTASGSAAQTSVTEQPPAPTNDSQDVKSSDDSTTAPAVSSTNAISDSPAPAAILTFDFSVGTEN